MGNSFEQNMPSKIKNEPFWDLGRPTIRLYCINSDKTHFELQNCTKIGPHLLLSPPPPPPVAGSATDNLGYMSSLV